MTTLDSMTARLLAWRDTKIEEARRNGAEMFMGLPDSWYEPPTWACANGHVSARYLKSERKCAGVCLACQERVWLVPKITEPELAQILSEAK